MNRKSFSILKLSGLDENTASNTQHKKRVSFNNFKKIRLIDTINQSIERTDLGSDKDVTLSSDESARGNVTTFDRKVFSRPYQTLETSDESIDLSKQKRLQKRTRETKREMEKEKIDLSSKLNKHEFSFLNFTDIDFSPHDKSVENVENLSSKSGKLFGQHVGTLTYPVESKQSTSDEKERKSGEIVETKPRFSLLSLTSIGDCQYDVTNEMKGRHFLTPSRKIGNIVHEDKENCFQNDLVHKRITRLGRISYIDQTLLNVIEESSNIDEDSLPNVENNSINEIALKVDSSQLRSNNENDRDSASHCSIEERSENDLDRSSFVPNYELEGDEVYLNKAINDIEGSFQSSGSSLCFDSSNNDDFTESINKENILSQNKENEIEIFHIRSTNKVDDNRYNDFHFPDNLNNVDTRDPKQDTAEEHLIEFVNSDKSSFELITNIDLDVQHKSSGIGYVEQPYQKESIDVSLECFDFNLKVNGNVEECGSQSINSASNKFVISSEIFKGDVNINNSNQHLRNPFCSLDPNEESGEFLACGMDVNLKEDNCDLNFIDKLEIFPEYQTTVEEQFDELDWETVSNDFLNQNIIDDESEGILNSVEIDRCDVSNRVINDEFAGNENDIFQRSSFVDDWMDGLSSSTINLDDIEGEDKDVQIISSNIGKPNEAVSFDIQKQSFILKLLNENDVEDSVVKSAIGFEEDSNSVIQLNTRNVNENYNPKKLNSFYSEELLETRNLTDNFDSCLKLSDNRHNYSINSNLFGNVSNDMKPFDIHQTSGISSIDVFEKAINVGGTDLFQSSNNVEDMFVKTGNDIDISMIYRDFDSGLFSSNQFMSMSNSFTETNLKDNLNIEEQRSSLRRAESILDKKICFNDEHELNSSIVIEEQDESVDDFVGDKSSSDSQKFNNTYNESDIHMNFEEKESRFFIVNESIVVDTKNESKVSEDNQIGVVNQSIKEENNISVERVERNNPSVSSISHPYSDISRQSKKIEVLNSNSSFCKSLENSFSSLVEKRKDKKSLSNRSPTNFTRFEMEMKHSHEDKDLQETSSKCEVLDIEKIRQNNTKCSQDICDDYSINLNFSIDDKKLVSFNTDLLLEDHNRSTFVSGCSMGSQDRFKSPSISHLIPRHIAFPPINISATPNNVFVTPKSLTASLSKRHKLDDFQTPTLISIPNIMPSVLINTVKPKPQYYSIESLLSSQKTKQPFLDMSALNEKCNSPVDTLTLENLAINKSKIVLTKTETESLFSSLHPEIARLFCLHIGMPRLRLMFDHTLKLNKLFASFNRKMEQVKSLKTDILSKCEFCSNQRLCVHHNQLKNLMKFLIDNLFENYNVINQFFQLRNRAISKQGMCQIRLEINKTNCEINSKIQDKMLSKMQKDFVRDTTKIKNQLERSKLINSNVVKLNSIDDKRKLYRKSAEQKIEEKLKFIMNRKMNPLQERLISLTKTDFLLMGSRVTIEMETRCDSGERYIDSFFVSVNDILFPMAENIRHYFQNFMEKDIINRSIKEAKDLLLRSEIPILLFYGDVRLCDKFEHLSIYPVPDKPFVLKAQILTVSSPLVRFAIILNLNPISTYQDRSLDYEIVVDYNNVDVSKVKQILDSVDHGMNKLYRLFEKLFNDFSNVICADG